MERQRRYKGHWGGVGGTYQTELLLDVPSGASNTEQAVGGRNMGAAGTESLQADNEAHTEKGAEV